MSTTITERPVAPEVIQQPVAPVPIRPQRDPIGELLERSADYIDQHGWAQDAWNDSQGHVCALGAVDALLYQTPSSGKKQELRRAFALIRAARRIRKTLGLSRWHTTAYSEHALLRHLPSGLIPVIGNCAAVTDWNDKVSTTQQDVVRGLREAAAKR